MLLSGRRLREGSQFSVKEFRERHRQTNIEMAWSISVNIMFSMIMLIPLFYTGILVLSSKEMLSTLTFYTLGYQVISRHMFLKMLTGTRADKDESYDNIIICISVSTVLMVFTSIMEALTYLFYSNKV